MTNSAYAKNKGDGLLCSILWYWVASVGVICALALLGKTINVNTYKKIIIILCVGVMYSCEYSFPD
jgi:hypothetical protein